MFASYGHLAAHKFLDEYPAEKFSEVLLIKYKLIQAARQEVFPEFCTTERFCQIITKCTRNISNLYPNNFFRLAKRKLDDFNFYGGTLHVCYAPEYEDVHDTREKLEDRRKAISARIRKLGQL